MLNKRECLSNQKNEKKNPKCRYVRVGTVIKVCQKVSVGGNSIFFKLWEQKKKKKKQSKEEDNQPP